MQIGYPCFAGIGKQSHRRYLMRIGAFHFREKISDKRGAKTVVGDALRIVNTQYPPPAAFDALKQAGFKYEIKNCFIFIG